MYNILYILKSISASSNLHWALLITNVYLHALWTVHLQMCTPVHAANVSMHLTQHLELPALSVKCQHCNVQLFTFGPLTFCTSCLLHHLLYPPEIASVCTLYILRRKLYINWNLFPWNLLKYSLCALTLCCTVFVFVFHFLHWFRNTFCFWFSSTPSAVSNFFRLQWEFQWENDQNK